jgi:hypothetical protein
MKRIFDVLYYITVASNIFLFGCCLGALLGIG